MRMENVGKRPSDHRRFSNEPWERHIPKQQMNGFQVLKTRVSPHSSGRFEACRMQHQGMGQRVLRRSAILCAGSIARYHGSSDCRPIGAAKFSRKGDIVICDHSFLDCCRYLGAYLGVEGAGLVLEASRGVAFTFVLSV